MEQEEKKPEFIATFNHGFQISNDYFDVCSPTKKVTRETTIGEIHDWYKNINKTSLLEVKLIQIEP